MSGTEVAERLLMREVTDLRLKKAARLLTPSELPNFLAALPENIRESVRVKISGMVR